MKDTERELRRRLRSWDPARRLGDPDARTVAGMQATLAQAVRRRPRLAPLFAVAALAAASLGALFLLPTASPVIPPTASTEPVVVEFTASNGIRIHWSVYSETSTDSRRHHQSEERHEENR